MKDKLPEKNEADAGLEDRNVPRPAPIDQARPARGSAPPDTEQAGLEDLDITRPSPPPVERSGKTG